MAMQDTKVRETRLSITNILVVSGHNNLEMLDIAEN